MQATSVQAGQGWGWYACGWRLFAKNPIIWIVLIVITGLITIALSLIPIVGPLAAGLIMPVLGGGLMLGAHRLDQGESLEIANLFQGFQDKTRFTPLITLGIIFLVAEIIIGLVGVGLVGGPMIGQFMATQDPASVSFGIGSLFGIFVILVFAAALAMAFIYAVPLVMLQGGAPIAAIKSSFDGSLKNIAPLFIFGILYIVFAIVAAIPFGLGFLVLFPWATCSVYCSYKSIFQSQ
ncbi:MAG: BPSS1780 family membrane protein [Gammaproteobacteria bacterium]|nr:BPSS1780 family membrane protein [Gammaproteobacteria bacterium]